MDWSGSCEQMIVQAKAIVNAQCSQCSASAICAKWNGLLDTLIAAVDGASYGGKSYSTYDIGEKIELEDGLAWILHRFDQILG